MKKIKKSVLAVDIAAILLCVSAPFLTSRMLSQNSMCFSLRIGLICPACGGTRCISALFRGDFGAAFRLNPAVFIAVFYFSVALLLCNIEMFFESKIITKCRRFMLHPTVLTVLVIGYIIVGFARNLI